MTDGQRTARRPSIGVIGAGWLGGTVGRALARAGYEVVLSTRHPERLKREVAGLATARAGDVDEAAACEVIVMATPYDAMPDYGARFAGHFAGKVVIDATNPSGSSRLGIEGARIGVGALSQGYFPAARLVRCFCAVDATCIEDTHGYGERVTLGLAFLVAMAALFGGPADFAASYHAAMTTGAILLVLSLAIAWALIPRPARAPARFNTAGY